MGGGGLAKERVKTGQVESMGDDDYGELVMVLLLGQAAGNCQQRQEVAEGAEGEEDDGGSRGAAVYHRVRWQHPVVSVSVLLGGPVCV